MPLAQAYADDLLAELYGSGSPATLYFALFTSSPNPDGTGGTEATGGGYARKAVTNNTTNFPAPSGGQVSNGTAVTFIAASGADWGTIEAIVVTDASSAGNRYDFMDLTTPRPVLDGDIFSITVGQFVVTQG
jgi:hypothetical protein